MQLSVNRDQRHLTREDGTAFFWLADTAWELIHRLDRNATDWYLERRAAQGFTVIQTVVLAELDGLNTPNAAGQLPLIEKDPARPNDAYFENVDYVVEKAGSLGMVVGLLPTWGDKWCRKWGMGPEIFTPENAFAFGAYLGERYEKAPLVWILGGDRNPETEDHFAITREMARGLREAGVQQPMTFHPQGGFCSADFFPDDEWLDFHMFQSGHAPSFDPNYAATRKYRELSPGRPVVDGEPLYEDHPINWKPANGWFDDFESRRAGYWSLLSGAMGHTYGNHNVWQMWEPGRDPVTFARTPWREAVSWPGANQAGFMRRAFESREWWRLESAPELIVDGPNSHGRDVLAARASDGSFLMVYTPWGSRFSLSSEATGARCWWFNPRDASHVECGEPVGSNFKPPGDERRGNDWLLVVDRDRGGCPPG